MSYLVKGPITQLEINRLIGNLNERTDSGGHSLFLGQVRADEVNGRKVTAIEYSAYEDMVSVEADKIIKEIRSEFTDLNSVEILHSQGLVKAGEFSLFVLVTGSHRHQAIEACSKVIELIKEKLPVWKREIFDDNSHEWKTGIHR